MTYKRRALDVLTKTELLEVGRVLELDVVARMSVDELRDAVAHSKRATLDRILPLLSRDTLKAMCVELGLSSEGREKQVLQDRILGESGRRNDEDNHKEEARSTPPQTAAASPAQGWISFPEVAPASSATQAAGGAQAAAIAPVPVATQRDTNTQSELTIAVEPRKPRLAWQGMDRKELAIAVPTQVVEIVWPGRAIKRSDQLAGLDTRQSVARDTTTLPPNRLIWTNDNLVALQTLLDERDPETRDYRYRGKVDLVYIDPPFMVNNDFRADNSIDIEIDEDEEVQAKKEPSLVEILAYRDTWRQGLDSFLTMLRRRLELLKELLAPTGSIYVHLDWHTVHYVKVLMDELFGYENLTNEIAWRRSTSHNDLAQGAQHLGRLHDTILVYGASSAASMNPVYAPLDAEYVRNSYKSRDPNGRRFQLVRITAPGGASKGNAFYELLGNKAYYVYKEETARRMVEEGRIVSPSPGAIPRLKMYLDERPGTPLQDLWTDIGPVHSQGIERLGYPTQKPVALMERIISLSSPPNGLVLDCFMGSGTTAEAAERLGCRWIGIDNGKYAMHLARKRLIQLHGQPRPPEKPQYDYVECDHCKNIERKEKSQRSSGPFQVRPFTVENMGVYQRAEQWQDFQTQRSRYRDEMIKVFGGEPVAQSPLLHGRKGSSWVHVGPLDGPVSVSQVWNIAREAQRTQTKSVTVLSADFDTLSGSEKEEILKKTGVTVIVRVIPASALDEVKRRLDLQRSDPTVPVESMAIPAFYAPLAINLDCHVSGRTARVTLDRCEIDIESFLASQRPLLKPVTEGMSAKAREKAVAEQKRWAEREKDLQRWLAKATTWQKFIDFWAVDWDYGRRVSPEGRPIFETDWQSFRVRRGKGEADDLTFTAELRYDTPGQYRIAARVTDVFGNDGIATVTAEVR